MNTSRRLIFSLASSPEFFRVVGSAHDWAEAVPKSAKVLTFERMAVNDDELEALVGYLDVRCIDLDATRVTDRSIAMIASLPKLEELWLEETEVTDAGLVALHSATKLKFLSVAYSRVTPIGVMALRAALSRLSVSE